MLCLHIMRIFLMPPITINHQEKISLNLNLVQKTIIKQGLPTLYVIIDEYDNFSNQLVTNYNQSLYKKLTSDEGFFKTFFKVLKSGRGSGAIANGIYYRGITNYPG